jgi:hypothetical protein
MGTSFRKIAEGQHSLNLSVLTFSHGCWLDLADGQMKHICHAAIRSNSASRPMDAQHASSGHFLRAIPPLLARLGFT